MTMIRPVRIYAYICVDCQSKEKKVRMSHSSVDAFTQKKKIILNRSRKEINSRKERNLLTRQQQQNTFHTGECLLLLLLLSASHIQICAKHTLTKIENKKKKKTV